MAYFKINEPNKNPKWIKNIDRANGTLEFSENRDGCFQQDSGFFADSEFAYLKFHFAEQYPELQYMTIDTSWRTNSNHMALEQIQMAGEEPVEPVAQELVGYADAAWEEDAGPQPVMNEVANAVPHAAMNG